MVPDERRLPDTDDGVPDRTDEQEDAMLGEWITRLRADQRQPSYPWIEANRD